MTNFRKQIHKTIKKTTFRAERSCIFERSGPRKVPKQDNKRHSKKSSINGENFSGHLCGGMNFEKKIKNLKKDQISDLCRQTRWLRAGNRESSGV